MVPYFGDFAEDATVRFVFNTFSSDDPSASVTITNLVDADLKVHKDGSVTQIVTDGATITIDFDGITGNHMVTIDTSVHADYAVGADYHIRMEGTTVDGATINAFIGHFSIENRFNEVDVVKWLGTAAATPTVAGVPEVDLTHVAGATTNVSALATNVDAINTLSAGATGFAAIDTVVDAIKVKTDFLPSATAGAAGGVFIAGTNAATTVTTSFTTTFTGNLTGSVGSVTGAVGSVTGAVGSVTGAVGSVAGNVDGNVSGTVASVVTKTGYALSSTGADLILKSSTFALAMADAVWDELLAGHVTADTAGLLLNDWQDGGRLDLLLDAIPTTAMRGTDNAATAASLATAQLDLDTITGSDGVTLATTQANYAPATATAMSAAQTDLDTITDTGVTTVALTSAAITDVWSTDTLTEAYAADGAAATPAQLLYLLLSACTEFSVSGTTVTCKKLDGSTSAATYTLDDGTSPTSRTRAT